VSSVAPVVLKVALHDAQLEVWNSSARFKVVACGRRFGKTFLAVNTLISAAGSKPGSINWWVAPRYDQTDVALRFFTEALPRELVDINLTKKTARLWNGSLVGFKTAKDPDSLRSEGLDLVVLDEAAFQDERVWPEALRPALADKKGRAMLIGTFDGENWFYDLYQRGQSEEDPELESWRFPSSANPFLDPREIEAARKSTTRAVFEQEWLANPLIYAGAVFDGARLQAATERPARLGVAYAGLDWGYAAPTVLEVCTEDPEGYVSWIYERLWFATELNERCKAITEACKRFDVQVLYTDAAGATENRTLAETLKAQGARTKLTPVPFGKFKESAIETRRYYLERGLEVLGRDCPVLIKHSKKYRYKEGKEEVEKKDDHAVDAATAFYASRRGVLIADKGAA
jgi:hypothetical protein